MKALSSAERSGAIGVVTVGVGIAVTIGTATVLIDSAAAATWVGAAALAIVGWVTLRSRTLVGTVLVELFLLFGATATALYSSTPLDFQGPNVDVARVATETGSLVYLRLWMTASAALWAGALLASLGRKRASPQMTSVSVEIPQYALYLCAMPLLFIFVGVGPHALVHANTYLAHSGPRAFMSLGTALAPIAVIVCGMFLFNPDNSTRCRLGAGILGACYEVVWFATDTRLFAVWFIALYVGGFLARSWAPMKQRVLLVVAVALGLVALQIPLGLRELPNHGLAASWHYILDDRSAVFGGQIFHNMLFGAPYSYYIGHFVSPLPGSDLFTSFNPLPGRLTDWAELSRTLRLNIYEPYSAIGELLNHGTGTLVWAMAVFGFAFCLIERLAAQCRGLVGVLAQIVPLGAAGLFVIESTEYNLRSSARLVYYAATLVVVLFVISRRSSPQRPLLVATSRSLP